MFGSSLPHEFISLTRTCFTTAITSSSGRSPSPLTSATEGLLARLYPPPPPPPLLMAYKDAPKDVDDVPGKTVALLDPGRFAAAAAAAAASFLRRRSFRAFSSSRGDRRALKRAIG